MPAHEQYSKMFNFVLAKVLEKYWNLTPMRLWEHCLG